LNKDQQVEQVNSSKDRQVEQVNSSKDQQVEQVNSSKDRQVEQAVGANTNRLLCLRQNYKQLKIELPATD
jgi:hypothetical protein